VATPRGVTASVQAARRRHSLEGAGDCLLPTVLGDQSCVEVAKKKGRALGRERGPTAAGAAFFV